MRPRASIFWAWRSWPSSCSRWVSLRSKVSRIPSKARVNSDNSSWPLASRGYSMSPRSRARDGVGDEIDEQGAGNDGHEAEAEEEAIQALEIGVRFAVGFQNDDVRSGLQAGGELDGVSVKTLVAQNQFGGDKFVGKAARKLRFLEQGKGADGNFAGFAEDDVAGGDASEIGGGAFADQPADDDKTEEIFARGVVVERLKNNLIEACAAEPPTVTFAARDGARNHVLGGGGGEGRSGGVEG